MKIMIEINVYLLKNRYNLLESKYTKTSKCQTLTKPLLTTHLIICKCAYCVCFYEYIRIFFLI